ncbi:MAG: HNH endonuclease [Chlorobiaceae bacterium]|nr:HNH endonuclease [Chlorobiaceae bacterium]
MAISDKNRKILWGKSGNRCAMCRHPLVVDSTSLDSESVVGDECHIISNAKGGPRHDARFPSFEIDELSNLMLLCRVHHKLVDDQDETYTVDLLRSIKENHEKWVENKLKEETEIPAVKIIRMRSEMPTQLSVIQSGKELLNLAIGCHGLYSDYCDDLDDEETALVGCFIQNLSDWADLGDWLEPIECIRAAKFLNDEIRRLKERGFMVFVAKEKQRIVGGISGPSTWWALHLSVKRDSDTDIVSAGNESC